MALRRLPRKVIKQHRDEHKVISLIEAFSHHNIGRKNWACWKQMRLFANTSRQERRLHRERARESERESMENWEATITALVAVTAFRERNFPIRTSIKNQQKQKEMKTGWVNFQYKRKGKKIRLDTYTMQ